jgi:hypothetical protein
LPQSGPGQDAPAGAFDADPEDAPPQPDFQVGAAQGRPVLARLDEQILEDRLGGVLGHDRADEGQGLAELRGLDQDAHER